MTRDMIDAPEPAGSQPEHPLPHLDPREVQALRTAAEAWSRSTAPAAMQQRGSLHPDVDVVEKKGSRPGDTYVRVRRPERFGFEQIGPGRLQARPTASEPRAGAARTVSRIRHVLLGSPRASEDSIHERLSKFKALATLSSDALSSVAYATEQILLVLVVAGATAYNYSLPIMAVILVLLGTVVLSYRQTIKAYPQGGGSYIVASTNLGPMAGLIAGSALMTDYILTVAVSVASGVDAIVSALPSAEDHRVALCVGFIVILMVVNLRGVKETGNIFALPTYLFIVAMLGMIGVIMIKLLTGNLHGAPPHIENTLEPLSLLIILKAFASGCTALTGVEAISDGVPAFKKPEWKNARITLTVMGVLLAVMFVGITVAAHTLGLVARDSHTPGYETIISQLAHHAFGGGAGYYYVAVATTAILILAANTSFSDFPRLFFFMARDDYAPHQFKRQGDRLAFSNGIIVLGSLAILLEVIFQGRTAALIPLYTIGVFAAFTMSQGGMVTRWRRLREPGWRRGLVVNAVGMCMTAVVFLVTAVSKLPESGLVLVIIPTLVLMFLSVHRHYRDISRQQTVETPTSPDKVKPKCIVPVADLNPVVLQTLAVACTIAGDPSLVIAVYVSDDEAGIARLKAKWRLWGDHVHLEVLDSPYRTVVPPLLQYIDLIDAQDPDDTLVVVLPELVPTRWWQQFLHNQTSLRIKGALLSRPGTVTANVPYHLEPRPRRRWFHLRREDPEEIL
ncbi:MAG: APC family permease [Candidatus Dormibacteria bacterium]